MNNQRERCTVTRNTQDLHPQENPGRGSYTLQARPRRQTYLTLPRKPGRINFKYRMYTLIIKFVKAYSSECHCISVQEPKSKGYVEILSSPQFPASINVLPFVMNHHFRG